MQTAERFCVREPVGKTLATHVKIAIAESARALKRCAPEPIPPGGESDERILQRGCENDALQPFRSGQSARKRGITVAGNFLTGFVPRHFSLTSSSERRDRQFRRLQRHGHAVARHGRNLRDRVADTNLCT
jgi:hypothetical protein